MWAAWMAGKSAVTKAASSVDQTAAQKAARLVEHSVALMVAKMVAQLVGTKELPKVERTAELLVALTVVQKADR